MGAASGDWSCAVRIVGSTGKFQSQFVQATTEVVDRLQLRDLGIGGHRFSQVSSGEGRAARKVRDGRMLRFTSQGRNGLLLNTNRF